MNVIIINDIVIIAISEDNYVNATQMCSAGNKRRMELIKELEMSETGNSEKSKMGNADARICASANIKNNNRDNQIYQSIDMEVNDNINYDTQFCASQNPKKAETGIPVSVNLKNPKIYRY